MDVFIDLIKEYHDGSQLIKAQLRRIYHGIENSPHCSKYMRDVYDLEEDLDLYEMHSAKDIKNLEKFSNDQKKLYHQCECEREDFIKKKKWKL